MCSFFRLHPGAGLLFLLAYLSLAITSFAQQERKNTGDKIIKTDSTNLELLLTINQEIVSDKATLQKLVSDSISLEPAFQRNTARFLEIDTRLDTLQEGELPQEELKILEIMRESSKRNVEFLLEYRRAITQQINILKRKINKMQEVAEFTAKGELAIVMEIAEQIQSNKDSDETQEFQLTQSDTTSISFSSINEYNWRVVVAERDLDLLKAKFEYLRKSWIYVSQVQNLNKDHLSTTNAIISGAEKQMLQLSDYLDTLNQQLVTLQTADTTSQLRAVIEERADITSGFVGRIANSITFEKQQVQKLESLINDLSVLQKSTTDKINDVTKKIERQDQWLEYLKSPLAPHNLYSFMINRGPRIVLILLIFFVVWISLRWLVYHILKRVIKYGSPEEREERIDTLNRAIRSSLTILFLLAGTITLLSEFGIDVSVLLGGAAVFSLAIAFGAQSLVKDYFSGFMILTENQYRIGNVVKINSIAGLVEDISLRTTTLRDLEGIAHFIPHGEITIVSNLTHQWSRVLLNIGVAYKENVDQVMEVIMHTARKMRDEPEYKWLITDDPEMLGVDAFADSAVVIKVLIKTRPMKQWLVKRELLRRLKNRFDELGIEIPFPHRTVYHRDLNLTNGEGASANDLGGENKELEP